MAACFQDQDDTDTGLDFVIADSCNSNQTMTSEKDVIADKTTPHPQTGKMDYSDSMAPEAQASFTFSKLTRNICIAQEETECGFRMTLHILIAGHSPSAADFQPRMYTLKNVTDLPSKCRYWVHHIRTDNREPLTHPTWVTELIP